MPSTYSPDLRIELIGQGEQDNLWGITTNNNLGSLIEQAICGVTNVVMLDAPFILTALDGAVDEARSAILNVTSSVPLTASRAVVAPAVPKNYVIANNTTGGQVITIISVANGTFVNIPAGGTSLVYCDGLNFYESITATSQLSVAFAPTTPTQVATKAYVDAAIGGTSAFPPGTTMLFVQTSAPVGWTQQNAYNDYALRVVAGVGGGTGGTVPFSTAFSASTPITGSVGATTLNATQIPAHNHGVTDPGHSHTTTDPGHTHVVIDPGHIHAVVDTGHIHAVTDPGHFHTVTITDPGHTHTVTDPGHVHPNGGQYRNNNGYQGNPANGGINTPNTGVATTGISINGNVTGITGVGAANVTGVTTQNTGGGGSHTHSFGSSVNLAVQYLNTIVCVKN